MVRDPSSALWRDRDFMLLWSGQAISVFGSQVSILAVPLLALALTRSPAQAGFIEALGAAPYLLLALPAGALLDRWNRRTTMICCDLTRGLAAGSIPLAYLLGRLTVAQLYAVTLVAGTAFVFFDIANGASLPRIVPAARLAAASAALATATWTVSLVGPALGGALIGLARTTTPGAMIAYAVNGVSFLVSAASLGLMRASFQGERDPTRTRPLRADVVDGLRFVLARRDLRALALLDTCLSLLAGPATLALIVLARTLLHADARTIGFIFSALSVGGVAGTLLAPQVAARARFGPIAVIAFAAMTLSAVVLALAAAPWMLVAAGAAVVCAASVYTVAEGAYRLSLTPDALQGRVNGVFRLLLLGLDPLTVAATGVLLGVVGPRPVLLLIAAAVGVATIAVSRAIIYKRVGRVDNNTVA